MFEVGPDLEFQSRLWQDSAFFSDPDLESKIWVKPAPDPESFFNFDSNRSLCRNFLSKNMGKLWLDSRSTKFSDPVPDAC